MNVRRGLWLRLLRGRGLWAERLGGWMCASGRVDGWVKGGSGRMRKEGGSEVEDAEGGMMSLNEQISESRWC